MMWTHLKWGDPQPRSWGSPCGRGASTMGHIVIVGWAQVTEGGAVRAKTSGSSFSCGWGPMLRNIVHVRYKVSTHMLLVPISRQDVSTQGGRQLFRYYSDHFYMRWVLGSKEQWCRGKVPSLGLGSWNQWRQRLAGSVMPMKGGPILPSWPGTQIFMFHAGLLERRCGLHACEGKSSRCFTKAQGCPQNLAFFSERVGLAKVSTVVVLAVVWSQFLWSFCGLSVRVSGVLAPERKALLFRQLLLTQISGDTPSFLSAPLQTLLSWVGAYVHFLSCPRWGAGSEVQGAEDEGLWPR
jgi:hypothetical protein